MILPCGKNKCCVNGNWGEKEDILNLSAAAMKAVSYLCS